MKTVQKTTSEVEAPVVWKMHGGGTIKVTESVRLTPYKEWGDIPGWTVKKKRLYMSAFYNELVRRKDVTEGQRRVLAYMEKVVGRISYEEQQPKQLEK